MLSWEESWREDAEEVGEVGEVGRDKDGGGGFKSVHRAGAVNIAGAIVAGRVGRQRKC